MKRCALLLSLLALLPPVLAQPVLFKGRVVALSGDALPADLQLRAEHIGPVDQGRSGEFLLELPPGTTRFTLRVLRPALDVVYPSGGLVSIPADPGATTLIVVGPGTDAVISRALTERDEQLENRLRDYGVRLDARQDSLRRDLRDILDALLGLRQEELPEILSLLRLRENDLRDALEQQRQREIYLPALAAALNDYVLKAKDLQYTFETLGADSHLSRAAAETLQQAMVRYNDAYTVLENGKDTFAQQVRAYWDDPEMSTALQQILTLAQGEIHHDRILPLNGHLVVVQRVFTRSPPDKDEVRDSRRRIADIASELEPRVSRLGDLTAQLLSNLARL